MDKFITNVNGKVSKKVLLNNPVAVIEGKEFPYKILSENKNQIVIEIGNRIFNVVYSRKNVDNYNIVAEGQNYEVEVLTELQYKAKELNAERRKNSGITLVKAPMPGLLLKVEVKVGDKISEGSPLFILEAMKMENEIKSETSGTIKEIRAAEGESVEKGAVILVIE
jgi:biotin carboxyl carrier protein